MSAQCQPIRDEIKLLEDNLDEMDIEIRNEDNPRLKSALIRLRKQILSHLQRRKADLRDCEAIADLPPDTPPGFVVFGDEVSQGLPDYQLVAGKNTLVRVFLGVKPQVVLPVSAFLVDDQLTDDSLVASLKTQPFLVDRPSFSFARIDFAELIVTDPDGRQFPIPGDVGDGGFDNFVQSYSEEDNANFPIDGRLLNKAGNYSFIARFYRNNKLVAQRDLGRHQFHRSKDLRVLIVVEVWPFPADKWSVVQEALADMSRVFPVRTGLGPLDGDLTNGVRYRIEPEPLFFQWPDLSPVRKRLDDFNKEQQQAGRPDRAEHILTVRTQRPGEMALGGTGDPGPNGSYAGTVLNLNPPADNIFGGLVTHELGHNFIPGTGHTTDEELVITDPAAFDVRFFKSINNPRSVMHRFYGTPNGETMFIPSQWQIVREGLMASSSTGT